MKKILLVSAFALFGTFAMANNINTSNNTFKVKELSGGWCEISIYDSNGRFVRGTTVWATGELNCIYLANQFLQQVEQELR